MGIILREEVRGFMFDDEEVTKVVCIDCFRKEDWPDLAEENIITDFMADNPDVGFIFCDLCCKRL